MDVPESGLAVPMNRTILNGFSVNGTYDTFTAQYSGLYVLSYDVKTRTSTTAKIRVTVNGSPLAETLRSTASATTNFNLSVFVSLNAGDNLQLVLYDAENNRVTLEDGVGVSFWLVRLNEVRTAVTVVPIG